MPVEKALGELWEDLGRVRAILTEAEAVRAGRGKVDERARGRLTELLRGRPHEVARIPIPLAQRGLTGPSETIVTVGIADCLDRMRAAFAFVAPFADEIAAVDEKVLGALAPCNNASNRRAAHWMRPANHWPPSCAARAPTHSASGRARSTPPWPHSPP